MRTQEATDADAAGHHSDDLSVGGPLPEDFRDGPEGPLWLWALVRRSSPVDPNNVWVRYFADDVPKDVPVVAVGPTRALGTGVVLRANGKVVNDGCSSSKTMANGHDDGEDHVAVAISARTKPSTKGSVAKAEIQALSLEAAFRQMLGSVVREQLLSESLGLGRAQPCSPPADTNDSHRRLFTITDVAKLAGVDAQTVRGWIRNEGLQSVRLGRNGNTLRIRASDYDDYLTRTAAKATPKLNIDDLASQLLRKRRQRREAK